MMSLTHQCRSVSLCDVRPLCDRPSAGSDLLACSLTAELQGGCAGLLKAQAASVATSALFCSQSLFWRPATAVIGEAKNTQTPVYQPPDLLRHLFQLRASAGGFVLLFV